MQSRDEHAGPSLPTSVRLITGKDRPSKKARPQEAPIKTVKKETVTSLSQLRRQRNFDEPADSEELDEMAESQLDTITRIQRMVTPEARGTFIYSFYQAKDILLSPKTFFAKMPHRATVAESALFLFIYVVTGGLLAGVINSNLLITCEFILINLTSAVLLSIILSRMMIFMGSLEGFEPTFRVVVYSQACLLIAGLKIPYIGYGTLLAATVYAIYLQILGLSAAHDMPARKFLPALIFAHLFIGFLKFKFNILLF